MPRAVQVYQRDRWATGGLLVGHGVAMSVGTPSALKVVPGDTSGKGEEGESSSTSVADNPRLCAVGFAVVLTSCVPVCCYQPTTFVRMINGW